MVKVDNSLTVPELVICGFRRLDVSETECRKYRSTVNDKRWCTIKSPAS